MNTRTERVTTHVVDAAELYRLIDERRRARGISWREVGRQTGVSSASFTRLIRGGTPDADGLVTLLTWLGVTDTRLITRVRGREGDGE